jgi:hypothetical protein
VRVTCICVHEKVAGICHVVSGATELHNIQLHVVTLSQQIPCVFNDASVAKVMLRRMIG